MRSPVLRGTAVATALLAALACSAPQPDAAPAAPAGPTVEEARAAIDAANANWRSAMLAGDTVGALANYTDDAVIMFPGMAAMRGRAEFGPGMTGFMGSVKVDSVASTTSDVMVGGDLAVETGTFRMTYTPTGAKAIHDVGKYLTVWKRQADGSWKIVRDINNTDAAPAAK